MTNFYPLHDRRQNGGLASVDAGEKTNIEPHIILIATSNLLLLGRKNVLHAEKMLTSLSK